MVSITRVGFFRKIRRAGHVPWMGAVRIAGGILETTPGVYRRNWEYNIKIILKKLGCENVGWIHTAQDTE
jgi:hypothetical protein